MEEEDRPARPEGEGRETPEGPPYTVPPPPEGGAEGEAEWEEAGSARGYWAVEERYDREAYDGPPARGGTGRATASMVLGIVGIFFTMCCCGGGMFGLISSILAWVLGHQEVKAIREGKSNWEGLGQARAGMIMGIIGTILNGLFMIGWVLIFVFNFAMILASGVGP